MNKIPFLDLGAQHAPLRTEIDAAIGEVISANAFAGGPFVSRFEEDFGNFVGCRHAVGVGSGTDALWLTLLALGITSGDEVITVSHSFMATAEAISFTGARPVFVDVLEHTGTMDPEQLEAAITPRTKAIIPVHLYGQPADMGRILDIAAHYQVPVVEDACQAHGATYQGRTVGSLGIAGCFSFYPGKNLGAWGEAGAVTTNDAALAAKVRELRDHGQARKYIHSRIGWNARMDGIQAAVLRVKLKSLAAWNAMRNRRAEQYGRLLGDCPGVRLPQVGADRTHVYHLFVVHVKNRDQVKARLEEQGVGCGIHYPIPIHRQEAYGALGLREGVLPVTERCAAEVLSLPMYPELEEAAVDRVCEVLKAVTKCEIYCQSSSVRKGIAVTRSYSSIDRPTCR